MTLCVGGGAKNGHRTFYESTLPMTSKCVANRSGGIIWVGYKVHVITQVETTPATKTCCRVTVKVHQALEEKELIPGATE